MSRVLTGRTLGGLTVPELTKRQWLILQAALIQFNEVRDADKSGGWIKMEFQWDGSNDGPVPDQEEIDELAEVVGRMPHAG